MLIVIYGEEHVVRVGKEDDQMPRTLTKNIILDVIKNELKMDCYYVMQSQAIFIKIDQNTLDNSVLNDC